MKTENTPENRAKFFDLYRRLKVGHWKDVANETQFYYKDHQYNDVDFCLLLTPLSQISDEDAAHIAMLLVGWPDSISKLTGSNISVRGREDGDHVWDELILEFGGSHRYTIRYRGGDFLGWINSNGRCEWTLWNHRKVFDFLRFRGYYVGDGTEIEYGWVKLKELNSNK